MSRSFHCSARQGGQWVVFSLAVALLVFLGAAAPGFAAQSHAQASARHRHAPSIIHGQSAPSAAVPTVMGPLPGTPSSDAPAGVAGPAPSVLRAFGYQEKEYLISGIAHADKFVGTPGSDGRWQIAVEPGSAAAYTTRIVVYTPIDARRFSGTVDVEWDNVTNGFDLLVDLVYDHATPFRDGDAYVGVSAQFAGVEAAKLNDPARYASLAQPGDSYSYDIFSQAGMALWRDPQLVGGMRARVLVASGDSQSASRLVTYVDGFAPKFNVYDAYLVHSRTGTGGAALQQPPGTASVAMASGPPVSVPNGNAGLSEQSTPPVFVSRTDLLAPVLYFMTQTDVYVPPYGLFGYGPATQPNSSDFRLWEVAGTAHVDDCAANLCINDAGDLGAAVARFEDMLDPPRTFLAGTTCNLPINTGEEGYVLGAARQQLTRWAVTGGSHGGSPASAAPLFAGQAVGETASTAPVLDAHGNIVGGVRDPAVDVPVATLTGVPNTPGLCFLGGSTTPFSQAALQSLYPTHRYFVIDWSRDVMRLVEAGYLTPPDALNLIHAATLAPVP